MANPSSRHWQRASIWQWSRNPYRLYHVTLPSQEVRVWAWWGEATSLRTHATMHWFAWFHYRAVHELAWKWNWSDNHSPNLKNLLCCKLVIFATILEREQCSRTMDLDVQTSNWHASAKFTRISNRGYWGDCSERQKHLVEGQSLGNSHYIPSFLSFHQLKNCTRRRREVVEPIFHLDLCWASLRVPPLADVQA